LESLLVVEGEDSLIVINPHTSPRVPIDGYALRARGVVGGVNSLGLLHVNHEQPWAEGPEDFRNWYGARSEESGDHALVAQYQLYDYVLRMYHDDELTSSSPVSSGGAHFVPVGPAYHGQATFSLLPSSTYDEQFTRAWYDDVSNNGGVGTNHFNFPSSAAAPPNGSFITVLPSSERRHKCILAARRDTGGHDRRSALEVATALGCYGAVESFRGDVRIAVDGAASSVPPPTPALSPIAYADAMRNAAFAPCPAGNNPETFRLYEALEAGAIPVLSRGGLTRGDFVSSHFGPSCPIPVVKDWSELQDVMDTVNVDALQRSIQEWYGKYKQRIANAVNSVVP
jgi:hypothetical protein